MRLYEVADDLDWGPISGWLKSVQAQSNKKNQPIVVPFSVVVDRANALGLPLGGLSSDRNAILDLLKKKIDPNDNLIDGIDSETGNVVLKTNNAADSSIADVGQGGGRSLDAMAKHNSDLTPLS